MLSLAEDNVEDLGAHLSVWNFDTLPANMGFRLRLINAIIDPAINRGVCNQIMRRLTILLALASIFVMMSAVAFAQQDYTGADYSLEIDGQNLPDPRSPMAARGSTRYVAARRPLEIRVDR